MVVVAVEQSAVQGRGINDEPVRRLRHVATQLVDLGAQGREAVGFVAAQMSNAS